MKIVMLGHSNAGKTTYIAMMYELMRSGYRDFRVRATDDKRDGELTRVARAVRRGVYPPPSSRRDAHSFVLTHRHQRIADFTWNDYRGGALNDRAGNEETAAVLAELAEADALVVFADAARLAGAESSRREVRRLTVLLQQAISERTRDTPVVIAYTKADLISGSAAWARATAPMAALQAAMATSPRVAGATVAVSCGANPRGVHVPVLWCMSQHVSGRVAELRSAVDTSRRLSAAAGTRATLWNSLISTLDGVESEYRRQLRHAQEAQRRLAELEPLEQPARELIKALKDAQESTAPPVAVGRP
ncbi:MULTISPECIES: hypothetical protein [unclassified Streptomyces]|uniref:TRAFAC clade GTPase domain-containing protein n=1 Tax=unclassified Streptomyces TaxID=2593676 RepID=UPI00380AEA08